MRKGNNRPRNKQGRFVSKQNEVQNAIAALNATWSRAQLVKRLLDPRRSINDDCGYPDTTEITADDYGKLYDRLSVATRVVQIWPGECWKVEPAVQETEDPADETEFEKAWDAVDTGLRADSKFKAEVGSVVWDCLYRADVLSGIGSFGILLLGLDDGAALSEPANPRDGQKLVYLRPFDERSVTITRRETDTTNSRHGQPTEYNVQFDNATTQGATRSEKVHWTRVIHVADNLASSEVFGVSRLRPVYDRCLDLYKLYGGSAEMYYRGAFPGLSVESHPQSGGDVDFDIDSMRTQIEQYSNTLQRYLAMSGVTVKSLAPQVVDPNPQIDAQIKGICIQVGVPKRIFEGSERGELASSQDKGAWNERVAARQQKYVTPRIIVPFVDRLVWLRVLPEPTEYSVVWPDLMTIEADERATIAQKTTEAIVKYVQGDGRYLMTPLDFLTEVLKLEDDRAQAILEAVLEEVGPMEEREPEIPEEEEPDEVTDEETRGNNPEGA